jgi:DNA-binding XRE family transcriptional regulator
MAWTSRDDADAAIVAGRMALGAAVRRARLRHGLSQQQLGWYVGLDQTTISRLETAKLKGMRFKMLARLIGMLVSGDAFELPDAPSRPARRLPGEPEGGSAGASPTGAGESSTDAGD